MPAICEFPAPSAPAITAGHIAGLRYKSGRQIFAGRHPDAAEFVSHPDHATAYPTQAEAFNAAEILADAFQIRNFDAITLFTQARA
jgi:hypothetical protein